MDASFELASYLCEGDASIARVGRGARYVEQMNLQQATQLLIEFRDAREWAGFHRLRSLLLALAGEVGEAAAEVQWVADEDIAEWLSVKANRDTFAGELADVFSYLLLVAHEAEIDLGEALLGKLRLNEERFPRGDVAPATELRDVTENPLTARSGEE